MKDLDSKETLLKHKETIYKKPFLRKIYTNFYNRFKNIKVSRGKLVELGSGGGFLRDIIPDVITSDVIKGPGIDKVFLASRMPFKKDDVSAFLMLNVLHHIKNPEKAFQEMERCLKHGGKIVMIEPSYSLWARFIYHNFHHEDFDPKATWKIKGNGRLSNANVSLPWIIFVRDKAIFQKKFPTLKIKGVVTHTPLLYLLSGGLSKPQLLPGFTYNYIELLEKLLSPFNKSLGMFVTIVLEKKEVSPKKIISQHKLLRNRKSP